MKIIIINGWHKGEVFDWHRPVQDVKLVKPQTVTVCDCTPDGPESFDYSAKEIIYRCAFKSLDGDVALFSTSGKSSDIFH